MPFLSYLNESKRIGNSSRRRFIPLGGWHIEQMENFANTTEDVLEEFLQDSE